MKYLDLTLPTPAANLACDEALLDDCDQGRSGPVLRFWESPELFVVLGYANHFAREVNVPLCQSWQLPILRRCSGGGAVLQGPGCLNYSLILRADEAGPLATVHGTNTFIMQKHCALFQALVSGHCPKPAGTHAPTGTPSPGKAHDLLDQLPDGPDDHNLPIQVQGHTDLTIGPLKFSGNAQRRRRDSLLFHGTFLLSFDLDLLEEVLLHPTKEPEYRRGRTHTQFVTNIPIPAARIKQAMCECWDCDGRFAEVPWPGIDHLVQEKYAREEWNLRRE